MRGPHLHRDGRRQSGDEEVAELVSTCHGIVVQWQGSGHMTRHHIIGIDVESIVGLLVAHEVERFLKVTHKYAIAYGVQRLDEVRQPAIAQRASQCLSALISRTRYIELLAEESSRSLE